MAPKNNAKGGDKKGKGAKDDDQGKGGKGGGGLKPATAINVRHILVCSLLTKKRTSMSGPGGAAMLIEMNVKCEKHSKKEEALEKLRNGSKFDDVAREFSEDKARQGAYSTHTLYTYNLC